MVYSTASTKYLKTLQSQTADTNYKKLSCGLKTVVLRGQSITVGNNKLTVNFHLKHFGGFSNTDRAHIPAVDVLKLCSMNYGGNLVCWLLSFRFTSGFQLLQAKTAVSPDASDCAKTVNNLTVFLYIY